MSIQRFEVGPRMSQAVAYNGILTTAGQVALDSAGKSVAEQTREVLGRIDALLAAAGTDKSKILTATIWLSDIGTFAEMNAVWDGWVAPGNTPARATVEAKLAAPAFQVEIQVTAAI